MTHITQEQADNLADKHHGVLALCNAAIEWHISQAAPQQADHIPDGGKKVQAEPLTEPEITAIYHSVYFNGATGRAIDFVRAIEAAHGIGGQQ